MCHMPRGGCSQDSGHPGTAGGRLCGMKRWEPRFHRESGLSCSTYSRLARKQDPVLRDEQGPFGPFHKDGCVARGLHLQEHRGARNLGQKVKAARNTDLGLTRAYM